MEWTVADMVAMDYAGSVLKMPPVGFSMEAKSDFIAGALPALHKREYMDGAPLCTHNAGHFMDYAAGLLQRLPEWLRGGVPSTEEKKFMNRVNAAARRNIARRKAAGSSLKSSQTVSGRR